MGFINAIFVMDRWHLRTASIFVVLAGRTTTGSNCDGTMVMTGVDIIVKKPINERRHV